MFDRSHDEENLSRQNVLPIYLNERGPNRKILLPLIQFVPEYNAAPKGDLKVSELESVRIGKCQNWKVSELESVRIGKCQNWKVPELESVRIGKCQNWKELELESVRI